MKTLTLVFVFVLLSLVLAGTLVKSGMANPWFDVPFGTFSPRTKISITSPLSDSTYNVNSFTSTVNIFLTFTIDLSEWYKYELPFGSGNSFSLSSIRYYLDGKLAGEVEGYLSKETYSLSVSLSGISNGLHDVEIQTTVIGPVYHKTQNPDGTISVHWYIVPVYDSSGRVYFTVDLSPVVTSPENKTYYEGTIPLTFIASEQASRFAYSLDGSKSITISESAFARLPIALPAWFGNLTLAGLSSGSHNLTLFATDNMDSTGISRTVYFTVAQETQPQVETAPQSSEDFPTTLVTIAIVASATIVSFGLVAYFLRRKVKRSEA